MKLAFALLLGALGTTAALRPQAGRTFPRFSVKLESGRIPSFARRSSMRPYSSEPPPSSPIDWRAPLQLSTGYKLLIGTVVGNLLSPFFEPLIDRTVIAVTAGLLSIHFIDICL
ncbi:hypothetical protein T492DRAFT_996677 [Pavlovales sp. CCMP2436]|nr:hypothetical protein T492DRAFT_996677 [Pavlovales sp. CCMP2436]